MSSKTTSVALGDHFREFAERKVSEGRYGSTSEVMLESEEQKLEALRAAIQEGLDSGPGQEFDFDAFLAAKRSAR
jgi:antitoxin ParD1/3/4